MGSENTKIDINISELTKQADLVRPNIFEFTDYREFLRVWFDYLKKSRNISIRKFAKISGLSDAYLVMMLSGKRPLSAKAFNKIRPHLLLEKHEKKYLEKLRLTVVGANVDTQHAAVMELKNHRNYKLKNQKEFETLKYLSHWYHFAIRELTADPNFSEDAKWIQKKLAFHVPLKNIRKAVKFLEKGEFLVRDQSGRLRSLDKKIHCTPKIFSHSLRSMHEQFLSLAMKSIDTVDSSQRMVVGSTVYVSDSQITKIRDVLQEAIDKISAIELEYDENGEEKGKIYHVEIAGFPMSDAKKKGNKGNIKK
jgi:uncharacterized protein (TIGR02147 family)